ncbi:MAG TPA: squalene synthase HpnC [Candidatus Cryosericum sp.]|nr:squalene synthase HpnC [Candidatus Cryosericum sp.]
MRTRSLPARERHDQSAIAALDHCARLAREHYENFPVASLLLPRRLRQAVQAIYAFARTADDIADEKEHDGRRLEALLAWEEMLQRCVRGDAEHPVFVSLGLAFEQHHLPLEPFLDLLAAFRLDVTKTRHPDFESLLDYCRLSANPVGRLILHLFGYRDAALWPLSDSICTALQLANHWQDVALDLERGRIYLPESDRLHHGVSEDALLAGRVDDAFRSLMREQIGRTRGLFEAGRPLCDRVRGRLRAELRLTWQGGWRILERIEDAGYDVFRRRPRLTSRDAGPILLRSVLWRR